MKIYTGMVSGEKHKKAVELGLGFMISSVATSQPHRDLGKTFCALDNGAFACHKKGYPFQSDVFTKTLKKCYQLGIYLDFIVCPDIVMGGLNSLEFSMKWAKGELLGTPNLALVLQDGMKPSNITTGYHLKPFSYLFIGGSVEWKWRTAKDWVSFARDNNLKIHIGQCGKVESIKRAQELGVDSVDSTSFARNDSFDILEKLDLQTHLFADGMRDLKFHTNMELVK